MAISDTPRLEKAKGGRELTVAEFIFVTRRMTAIDVLQRVQSLGKGNICALSLDPETPAEG